MQSVNPVTGELIQTYEEMTPREVDQITEKAHDAFLSWRGTDCATRRDRMVRVAGLLRANGAEYADLMTREMGKTTKEALLEIEKCAWVCEYYAEHAAHFLADEDVVSGEARSFVTYQPIGIVLAIMPWNFPFWQVIRFAAPTLMAGNAALLKHAANVSGSAFAIEALFREAGFPADLLRTLLIEPTGVGAVIRDKRVRAVTLTGSTRAGSAVALQAGAALKKAVLELGGSDPYVVLEDADISRAVESCVTSRMINAGQSCIAAKRFIVVSSVYDEFLATFTERMRGVVMGDPTDPATDIGPLASVAMREGLHAQVTRSVQQGARLVLGGEVPAGVGAYYPPTLLADVAPAMPAYEEELFGPVASVIRAESEADAIRIANDSPFGLGGAVFTRDVDRGLRIARDDIQAGTCIVNGFVKSDPRLPFGGVKESGYGRELSRFGIHEFVNVKVVSVGK